MSLFFRGVDPAEYGPIAAQAIEAALETRSALTLLNQEITEQQSAAEQNEVFWRCYEASQFRVAALKGFHQRLDQMKPAGRKAWAYHSWTTKYVNAVVWRTDCVNNILASSLEGPSRELELYQKNQDMLEKGLAQQTGYLVWWMNELLRDGPLLVHHLCISPDLPFSWLTKLNVSTGGIIRN